MYMLKMCFVKFLVEYSTFTAISSDSQPPKFEMLDINDYFWHSSAVVNSIAPQITTRQIRIRSTPIFQRTERKQNAAFSIQNEQNYALLRNYRPRSNVKNNYCCQTFWVRWSRITRNCCTGKLSKLYESHYPSRWNLSKFVAQFKTFCVRAFLLFRCFSTPFHLKIRVLLRYFAGK